eukprot:2587357-Prymnesium_polylepis.1
MDVSKDAIASRALSIAKPVSKVCRRATRARGRARGGEGKRGREDERAREGAARKRGRASERERGRRERERGREAHNPHPPPLRSLRAPLPLVRPRDEMPGVSRLTWWRDTSLAPLGPSKHPTYPCAACGGADRPAWCSPRAAGACGRHGVRARGPAGGRAARGGSRRRTLLQPRHL